MQNSRIIIASGFLLLALATLALVFGLLRSRQADLRVTHTFEVQHAAQAFLISTTDAESAVRSYLLSMEAADLDQFAPSLADAGSHLKSLTALTADNIVQQGRVKILDGLIGAKAEQLQKCVALAKSGERDAALAIINSRDDRELLTKIRAETEQVLYTERNLLDARQAAALQSRYLFAGLIGVALLTATILAAILAVSTRAAVKGLLERGAELEAESKRRLEAEATLQQSQKMEAVGQLTGGIAHDFNNLLTVIIGNLDTIKRKLAEAGDEDGADLQAKLAKPVQSALKGANAAAQLTQRLLAFSRRQALEPKRVDLNRLVTGMVEILHRSLGEDIELETVLGAGVWPTFVDPHQVENVLLNLALNAKAAMPHGGHLNIETANCYLDEHYVEQFGDIEAGEYVMLCVSDTGTGIAKEVLERVFEPFFTTKPQGEGSGLGLAMVHGFVKQSGGHVRIYSEEGQGTTVKIYLPRASEAEKVAAVPAGKPTRPTPTPSAKKDETVLVVEDNDGVREYAVEVLEGLGYRVFAAGDAKEALSVLADGSPIDLLFTDVVLPGAMNGRALADQARGIRPGLRVLFTTGYTRNAIVHQGRLDPGVQLLNKPYTQHALARKVRAILDA
ncbi:CHASE3 domain-containing protein [Methyloceanibacter sp.]|uniref:CHASE3 domain-containing protein n=1 Tax=Methyloceanibacter sp. TaxID=1965321 RepID=UPI002D690497|nr:CHASE3 domain-containing protein [Methyloceanibacter sp.]HZP10591.1 CHASE3 domain-containing protein [Methyloceanibacter sp.]